jgi:hypothetical protein
MDKMLLANDIGRLLRFAGKVVFEDALSTGGIPGLSIEGRPRVMRDHAIAAAQRVFDRAPYVVLGRGLDVPDIAWGISFSQAQAQSSLTRTRVTRQLAASESPGDGILVANGTTSRVYEPSTLLEVFQEFVVYEAPGAFVKRAVDGHDIALC